MTWLRGVAHEAHGKAGNPSHFREAAGWEHISWQSYFASIKTQPSGTGA